MNHMRDYVAFRRWKQARDTRRENWLALLFIAIMVVVVAIGVI